MKKPNSLNQLIEELQGEALPSTVDTTKDSKIVVYPNEEASDKEDGITLNRAETQLVLANENTVERFHEALGSPEEASIVLFEITLAGPALDALEKLFAAVDEG